MRKFVSSIFFNPHLFRSFSTAPTRLPTPVYRLTIPLSLSQNLFSYYQTQLQEIAKVTNSVFKPTTAKQIISQQNIWQKFVADFPDFQHQIEESKDSEVIVIDGIKIPEIDKQSIPKSRFDETIIYKDRNLKISEVIAGLVISQLIDFEDGQAFNLIYPTEQGKGSITRFDSDGKLIWHNDNWLTGPDKVVALFAIKGNNSAITKVITARQIEDYFKANGKVDFLKYLERDFVIKADNASEETYFSPILKDGKVRYSEYGYITTSSKEEKEALDFFRKSLYEIEPAISISLQNGQALIIKNQQALHARDTKDNATIPPQSRLVLRANVEGLIKGDLKSK